MACYSFIPLIEYSRQKRTLRSYHLMIDNNNPAKEFYNLVMQNPSLQDNFIGATDEAALLDLAVQLGQKNGYVFTAQELKASIAQTENLEEAELNDSLLAAVAGGKDMASGSSGSVTG
jgi:predicted ribosomally synthesized peptide with nif11-like leader